MTALNEQHCSNDVEYTLRPKEPQSQTYLTSIDSDWQINLDEQCVSRQFEIKNRYQTMALD